MGFIIVIAIVGLVIVLAIFGSRQAAARREAMAA